MARSTLTSEAQAAALEARRDEAQRRYAESARVTDNSRRALFSAFGLWTVCPAKICRRQRACRGDAARCMNERWHVVVPPELKALLGKVFENMSAGLDLTSALAAARAAMATHARQEDEGESRSAANAISGHSRESGNPALYSMTTMTSPKRPSRPRGPRLRAL